MKRHWKRRLTVILSAAMLFSMTGMNTVFATEGDQTIGVFGLCDHHSEHNQEICGYTEGMSEMPCTHEHTGGCCKEVTDCAHTHTDACYEAEVPTAIDSDEAEPVSCTHICDEDSGCITKVLDCPHERGEHDADCGHAPAVASVSCGFVCEDCAKDSGQPANSLPFALFGLTGSMPTEIWVNGANILQDGDKTLDCGSGTAVYEESSNTLTLNAAVITAREGREGAGIYANGDLRIALNGSSSVNSGAAAVGVKADGALNISGSGSLHVDTEFAAFVSQGDMTLAGGVITASSMWSNAFYAQASLEISGGDITASTANNYPALWADTDLTLIGGKVIATSSGSNGMGAGGSLSISGTADVTAQGSYPGLFAAGGISISGGKVNATGTNDSGIFTNGTLSISGTADVTATGGLYCGLQANGAITISGGKVNAASPYDSAIYTPVSITVTGSPEITAKGYLRALQTADLDISDGTINATSTDESAITATTKFSITGNANVIANGKICALLAEDVMILSAKNIEAYSETNYAVSNVTKDEEIVIGGKLIAESQNVYAIRSYGDIIADNNADISATGGWGGIQADGDITFTGSKIEAVGNDDDGIYSTGVISINGGFVHAKGAAGYAAIRAKSVQTAGETAASKIELNNLIEKSGGKAAFIDWFVSGSETKSFTSFIGKEDTALDESMANALNEVWLAVPYTVTFDVNGGDGSNSTEKVYPGNKVEKPTDPIKMGSIFSGWYNGGTAFDFENIAITEDIMLTANWHVHSYGTDWKSDAANHWHECTANDGAKSDVTAHMAGGWIVDKAATETEKGSRHKECTVCLYVMETEEISVIPPQHTHIYGTDWKSDAINHWHECTASDGAKSEVSAHTASGWMIDKAAAETEKGSRHKECTVCRYVMESEEIPALPTQHTHSPSSEWTTDGTNHWHECTAGDGEKMDLAAHTAGGWIIDKAATEAEKGSRHKECTVCRYVMESGEIPKEPHTHIPSVEWEMDANNHWNKCSCSTHMNVAAHSYGTWTEIKAATETETGSKKRVCSVCGYEVIADIPAAGKTDSPQTGNSSNMLLWVALLFVSGGVWLGIAVISKKKRRFE